MIDEWRRANGAEARAAPSGVRLLEVDPDLAEALSGEALDEARRRAVLPALELAVGPWSPDQLAEAPGARGSVHGFLVLSGAVTMNVRISGRSCVRLITPGELMLLDGREDGSIALIWGWSILEPARLAILDQRLEIIGQRWPQLMIAILARGAQQTRHALLQQAIGQLPRVEDRLLALFWSIADRWGVMRADGVFIHLPVTQETLAQMIGARRPTVSLGLKQLVGDGLITARDDGWLLRRESLDALMEPATPTAAPFPGPSESS